QQAIVLRFGEFVGRVNPIGAEEPGVRLKLPFIDTVILYPKRNLGLTIQVPPIVAADQERLLVDAFVRWRITDSLLFYQSAQSIQGGQVRLTGFTESAMRRVLGAATSNDIISGRRAELMQAIETDLNTAAASELGVSVVDVRIRRADLPEATQVQVYQRMRTEREQVAARIRAEGAADAQRIRAEADREATVIEATAREESERTRGIGDGERARIFARAYGRDPEFAAFYRSMRAYEEALVAGTPIVVPPDSDFFRYMQRRQAR
ncbi:MAG: protease modulator HflC, partial [Hyphomonadaceae bacterium]|nr:protease modulator HflC [Hyphomonadaceae bacterium]